MRFFTEEGQKRRNSPFRGGNKVSLARLERSARTRLIFFFTHTTSLFYHLQVNAVTTENNLVTGVKPNQCFTKKQRPRRRSSWNLPATRASARACTKSNVARRLKSVGTQRVRVVSTVNWRVFVSRCAPLAIRIPKLFSRYIRFSSTFIRERLERKNSFTNRAVRAIDSSHHSSYSRF